MESVSIEEAASQLPKLIERVQAGHASLVITKEGSAVAYITPVPTPPKRATAPHPQLSKINVGYDPSEPLKQDEWPDRLRACLKKDESLGTMPIV